VSRRLVLPALVAVLAALALAGSAGAVNFQVYNDAAGDSGNAPDVTRVTVLNTSAGDVGFHFTFANRPATGLGGEDLLVVGLDTDRNGRTGDPTGCEYVVVLDALEGAVLGRWTGEAYDWEIPQRTLDADGTGFGVNVAELGGAQSFDFFVLTALGEEDSDVAPEGAAMFSFTLDLRPLIVRFTAAATPRQPVAGKPFSIGNVVVEIETGTKARAGTFTCTARLAGKVLKPVAKCRWKLPPRSKGKTLAVTVTMTYKGATLTSKPIAFKVR
jgi:hypothetical protein